MTPSLPPPARCHSAVAPALSPPLSLKLSKVFVQKKPKKKEKTGRKVCEFSEGRVRAGTGGDAGGCLGRFSGNGDAYLGVTELKRGEERTALDVSVME